MADDPTARKSEADNLAAMTQWLEDNPSRWGERRPTWQPVIEERIAAVADGRPIRGLTSGRDIYSPAGRWVRDEAGNVTTDGGHSWHFEPESA